MSFVTTTLRDTTVAASGDGGYVTVVFVAEPGIFPAEPS